MTYNEKAKQNTINYIRQNLEEIRFWVQKGEKQSLIEESQRVGYSAFSRYIIDAVNGKAGRNLLTMPRERNAKKKT